MGTQKVMKFFRAVCIFLTLALFAPLIAATPAQAAVVSFNCATGGGTYQVNNGTLTGTTGTCTGDLVLDASVVGTSRSSLSGANITSLTLPIGFTTFANPFWYNRSLTSISVEQGNSNFSSQDGVLLNASATTLLVFPPNKSGSTYSTPNTVTSIADYAFASNRNLTTVDIGADVTYIGDYSFFGAESLSVINIGAGVSYLGFGPFVYLPNLTSINVNQANSNFSDIDGVLYDEGITFLYVYPAAKSGTTFTAPSTVVQTGYMAFARTKNLITADLSPIGVMSEQSFMDSSSIQEVTYGNSISQIKTQTFQSARALRRLNLGTGFTTIAGGVFYSNTSFSCVVYTGSNSTIRNFAYPNGVTPVSSGSECLTAPAFTLSSSSETLNAGTAINGYTINSTGGAIASYEISPSISNTPGLRFSTATGFISETPTVTAAIRTYTITARNIVGTASQTFSVTVNPEPREVACGTGTYTVHMGIASAGSDCTGALVIDSSVTEIAAGAFADSLITSLTLPSGLRTIRQTAFGGAGQYPTLVIPNSVTLIENGAFQQGQYTSLTIGNGVTAIGESTFYRNYGNRLTSITFGTGLTSIGFAAFNMLGVEKLVIPEGVTSIATRAFDSTWTKYLTLPNSLTSVSPDAFVGANLLYVKYCGSTTAVLNYDFGPTKQCGAIVEFNANSGSGSMNPSLSGTDAALPSNTFTRTGFTLSSWNTNSTGTGTSYAPAAIFPYTTASNTTLYAIWAPEVPAFTLSSATENATAGTNISGYSINSTGGAISSFAISPGIENGLTFSSTTGLISGTPTNSASSKVYTITGTNSSGSFSTTFSIVVAPSPAQIAAAAAEAQRLAAQIAATAAAAAAEAQRIADAAVAARVEAERVAAEAKAKAEAEATAAAAAAAEKAAAEAEAARLLEVAQEKLRAEAAKAAEDAAKAEALAKAEAEATAKAAEAAAKAKAEAEALARAKAKAEADALAAAKAAQALAAAKRAALTGTKKVSAISKVSGKKAILKLVNLKQGTKITIAVKTGKK